MKDIIDDPLKDLIIAIGGFIVVGIQLNEPAPNFLAIFASCGCMTLAIYLNLTEPKQ